MTTPETLAMLRARLDAHTSAYFSTWIDATRFNVVPIRLPDGYTVGYGITKQKWGAKLLHWNNEYNEWIDSDVGTIFEKHDTAKETLLRAIKRC